MLHVSYEVNFQNKKRCYKTLIKKKDEFTLICPIKSLKSLNEFNFPWRYRLSRPDEFQYTTSGRFLLTIMGSPFPPGIGAILSGQP